MEKFIIIVFLLLSQVGYSQVYLSSNSQHRNSEFKTEEGFSVFAPKKSIQLKTVKSVLGLQIGIAEPILGLSYERLFSSKLAAEVAIGLICVSIGPKVYFSPVRPEKVNFYVGVIGGAGYFSEGSYGYLPIGISRLWKNYIMLSFDVGPHTGNVYSDGEFGPGARFKVGKAF
ncbi:hypothetical protein [Cyclobacterium jeungdonense]|uniref:DUF3575 domain-containing protein n=1 Tax=Cyclobacterium jeungdonense TaxID=708087 RepID=A0ABT8CB53_9BACT|nr:hypothetical protein [Cyclobacterium jeungdonense]MDN3688906.1 hypothetical protein [Cyclobacterium jeungdonense]